MDQHVDGVFSPEELKVVYQAFDEAWKELEPWFEDDPEIADAMTRLALTVLALAGREERETNPTRLATSALRAFQWRPPSKKKPLVMSRHKSELRQCDQHIPRKWLGNDVVQSRSKALAQPQHERQVAKLFCEPFHTG
jgi:hypothetical protein